MDLTAEGVDRLVEFASQEDGSGASLGGDERRELVGVMAGRSGAERWEVLADAIVGGQLAGVVPEDVQHRQAARAELVNAMAHEGWEQPASQHLEAAGESIRGAEAASARIREHYAQHSHPYPAAEPSSNPPPLPLATDADRAMRSALSGQLPPRTGQPTRTDGARKPQPTTQPTRDTPHRG